MSDKGNIDTTLRAGQAAPKAARREPFPNGPTLANDLHTSYLYLITIAFALFLASGLFVRNEAFDIENTLIVSRYLGRITKVALCLLAAFLLKDRLPQSPRMLFLAFALEVGYILLAYLPSLLGSASLPGNTTAVLYALAGIAEGAAIALFTLAFLHFISLYPPRYSGICVTLAIAGSHGAFLLTLLISGEFLFWLKPLLLLGSTIALVLCSKKTALFSLHPLVGSGRVPSHSQRKAFSLAQTARDLSLVVAGTIVFPFLYVLIAETNASANSNSGFFDIAYEIAGIATLFLLALVMFFGRNHISIEATFIIVHPIFATAMVLLPLFWGNEIFVSGFMIKCGFLLYNALLWAYLAKQAFDSPSSTYLYFGVAIALYELSALLGRIVGRELYTLLDGHVDIVGLVSLVAIWILAMGFLIFFLISNKKSKALIKEAEEQTQKAQSVDGFTRKCELYAEKHGLSTRELEVLFEFARGRSASYIAEEFFISKETAKTHLKRIYAKADVHNRQELLDGIESTSEA